MCHNLLRCGRRASPYPLLRRLFQGWILDVVLGRVLVDELVHDVGALTVGVVDPDKRLPLVRECILRKDRLDRTLRFAGAAVDALLRIYDEDALDLVNAIDGADVDAGEVFDVDAGLSDDVRHRAVTLLRRSAPRRPEPR